MHTVERELNCEARGPWLLGAMRSWHIAPELQTFRPTTCTNSCGAGQETLAHKESIPTLRLDWWDNLRQSRAA